MKTWFHLILTAVLTILAANAPAAVNVSGFEPKYGAPGDVITISGSGFYPGTLTVRFNGVLSGNAQATAADGTVAQAYIPNGASTGPITVQVGASSGSSAQDFIVIGPGPYVDDFAPKAGSAGSTVVDLSGKRFYYPTPVTSVTFNGKAAAFTILTDTHIQVTTPALATTGPIKLTTALGSYTTSLNFCITPSFSGFAPASGRAGTNVVLTGENFSNTVSVTFNSVPAPGFVVLGNGAIRATAPTGVTKGKIRVITPAGSADSTTSFVVPPTIFGFTPAAGPAGTIIVVTGANFDVGALVVTFNGTPAAVSGVTFDRLLAQVPAGATTGPLSILTPDGGHTSVAIFYLPPVITGITPNKGGAGTPVLISGQNLTNATAVTFDGVPAVSFTVSNNMAIYAVAPAGVSSGRITVINPGGTAVSPDKFYAAPLITLFSPTHGLPGTNVALYGKNFLDATAVEFNGTPSSFSVASNGFMLATVPTGAQTGPITVKTPGGTNTTATPFVLDYASDLGLGGGDSPDPVWQGSNLVYSLTLTNGGPHEAPHTRVTFNLPTNSVLKSLYSSRTGTTWTTNGNVLTADLGTITPVQNVSLVLTVAPMAPGLATFTATAAGDYTDPQPANNTVVLDTLVRPPPVLDIQLVATNRVRITWPEMLSNFVLQYRPDLDSGSYWSNNPAAPVILDGRRTVTERTTNNVRFYRLQSAP